MMGADPTVAMAQQILRWVGDRGHARFTRREVHQAVKGSVHTVADLDPPIALLIEHGYIRRTVSPRREGPGRPSSQEYAVNPRYRERFPQNPQNGVSEDIEHSADGVRQASVRDAAFEPESIDMPPENSVGMATNDDQPTSKRA